MIKSLVIVESPTKARLVGRYVKPILGDVWSSLNRPPKRGWWGGM